MEQVGSTMKKTRTKKRFAYARWRRKHYFKHSISQLRHTIEFSYNEYFGNLAKAADNVGRVMRKAFDTKGWATLYCLPKEKDDDNS